MNENFQFFTNSLHKFTICQIVNKKQINRSQDQVDPPDNRINRLIHQMNARLSLANVEFCILSKVLAFESFFIKL